MNEIMRRLDPNNELSQLDWYHTKLKIIRDVIYPVASRNDKVQTKLQVSAKLLTPVAALML